MIDDKPGYQLHYIWINQKPSSWAYLWMFFLIGSSEVGRSTLNWNHLESEEPSVSEPRLLVVAHLRWHGTGKLWLFAWLLSLCQAHLSCRWDILSSVIEPTSSGCQCGLKISSSLGTPQNSRSRLGLTIQSHGLTSYQIFGLSDEKQALQDYPDHSLSAILINYIYSPYPFCSFTEPWLMCLVKWVVSICLQYLL